MNQVYRNGQKLLRGAYTQYTPSGKALFDRAGAYHKEPKQGDVVYFYSSSMGRVCHVGAVVSVKKDGPRYTIETVEGNTSGGDIFNRNGGCVAKKRYSFTLSEVGGVNRVNGFGTPNFGDDTCTVEEFVNVLLGEVGYIEKASNKDLESKTANPGVANYTKYGKWFKEKCGGDFPAFWCQQFISWCAFKSCQMHLEISAKNQWIERDDGWHYKNNDGSEVKNAWQEIAGRWYVFDDSGKMVVGWFKANDDDWYYLNVDGAMLAGQWLKDKDKWYYFTDNGLMAKSVYVKDEDEKGYCWLDRDGAWDGRYVSSPSLNVINS